MKEKPKAPENRIVRDCPNDPMLTVKYWVKLCLIAIPMASVITFLLYLK